MRENRLFWIGFGFAVLNASVNVGLRFATMPIIGWQPSLLTAEIWLGVTAFGAVVGLSIMLYGAIPANLNLKFLPLVVRNGRIFALWLIAILMVGIMGWQSITIYQFQAERLHLAKPAAILNVDNSQSPFRIPTGANRIFAASGTDRDTELILPAATGSGDTNIIEKTDSNPHRVVVTPDSSDAINGSRDSVPITIQNDFVPFVDRDRGQWAIQ
jgi:hypothetical protein